MADARMMYSGRASYDTVADAVDRIEVLKRFGIWTGYYYRDGLWYLMHDPGLIHGNRA